MTRNITLTAAQRETLISMDGQVWKTTDKHGNAVYAKISAWKGQRLYIEFRYEYSKNSEKSFISLTDENDVVVSFSDTCAEMLFAWVEANTPAASVNEAVEAVEEFDNLPYAVITSDMIIEAEIAIEEVAEEFDAWLDEKGAEIGVSGAVLNRAFWDWRNGIIENVLIARGNTRWMPYEWADVGEEFPFWETFYEVIFPAIKAGDVMLADIPQTVDIFA